MRQEMVWFEDGSGISWTIGKQSAPLSRHITTPTPHHSIFTGQMLFLTPKQQCQGTLVVIVGFLLHLFDTTLWHSVRCSLSDVLIL